MATYTRQSTFTDGDTIFASLLNNEYDQLVAAFNVSSGHTHDGTTTGDGGPISNLFSNTLTFGTNTNNDISITFDATSNDGVFTWMEDEDYFQFSDDILLSTDEKLLFRDSAIYINSSVDGQLDLVADTEIQIAATTIDINGNTEISGNLTLGSSTAVSSVLDEDNMASDSATALATQQSIKAYVDAQVTVQDLDFSGDAGGSQAVDLDSQSLTLTGGTGINTTGSAQTMTFAIDSTVATLTDTQTFTNKTLTSPVLNTGVSGTAILDEDNMASDSATQLATQQSIKAYVDSQVATANELSELTDTNITSAADGALLFYDTATSKWIDNVVSGDITIADTGVAAINSGVIVNADVNASAAIDATKIHDGSVSNTEFGYLNGVTSNIQTQLTSLDTLKAPLASPTFTGTVSAPTPTAGDSSTKVATTAFVTNAVALENELSEMNDVTITSVADADFLVYDSTSTKWENQSISGDVSITNTGVASINSGVIVNADVNASAAIDATKIHDGSVTNTEFGYIRGLTSDAQTQLNAKLENVVEDTTPQLGGTLDANGNNIDMGNNLITDTKVGQWDTAYSWGDHSTEGYITSVLQAIATTKSDTAVDVFIYDTRKDSDGGAWRKRTQNTSWYNETLNTATRGSRKEFPAVAVLVLQSDCTLTIYDGDDPSLPMWMVFLDGKYTSSVGAEYMTGSTYAPATSISMINARVVIGRHDSTYAYYGQRITVIDFIRDEAQRSHSSHAIYVGNGDGPYIANRNQGGWNPGTPDMLGNTAIVNNVVNDVTMTVLPDAPIDNDTGLPVPTIAVATDGGVSVIKDDGTVVDITGYSSGGLLTIDFDEVTKHISTVQNNSGFHTTPIPSSDTTRDATGNFYTSATTPYMSVKKAVYTGTDKHALKWSLNNSLALFNEEFNASTTSSVAQITSDYNTGWMNGDIKLATLSDTDDTNLTGSELVTNGTFDTDISGWSDGSGTGSSISWESTDGGRMYFDGGAAYAFASYGFSTVVGKSYTVKYEVKVASSASGNFFVGTNVYSSNILSTSGDHNNVGFKTHTFVATGGTSYITIKDGYSTLRVDNVSVRQAVPDRSYNNNGLQVFGTVNKNAVATGADLVSYSGFSSSNYLLQPANSDLVFGTNDFSVMGWYKPESGSIGNREYIVNINKNNSIVAKEYTNYFVFAGATSTTSVTSGLWYYFCNVVKDGTSYLYVNGKLEDTATSTKDVTSNDDGLMIGNNTNNTGWYTRGNLALLRISSTTPTAEQVAKIYNDEKFLFQENAKATLYGTSNDVKALAYDDTTKLLHAGTSNGRSVFNGLRRVDNTTDAVGTAISASNGLVVDE